MSPSALAQPAPQVRVSIRASRQSATIRGLWVMYLLWVVAAINLPSDLGPGGDAAFSVLYRLLNYLIYVPVLVLVFQACRRAGSDSRYEGAGTLAPIVRAILCILGLMAVVGLLGAADPVRVLRQFVLEALPFLAMTLVLQGRSGAGTERAFCTLVSLQSLIGGVIAVRTLAIHPIVNWRSEINVAHETAFALIAPATLAVLMLPSLVLWQRIAALAGYAASIALGFAYQGRLTALLQVVALPVAWVFVQHRLGLLPRAVARSVLPVSIVAAVVAAAAIAVPAVQLQLESSIEGTVNRLLGTRALVDTGGSSETKEARWEEASEFVLQSSAKTWLVGEGIGGTWRSAYMADDFEGNRWPMVHFGPLHLVLKGGLPLLVLFHVLYAMIVLRLWRASRRNRIAAAVLVYAVFAYIGFLSHGPLVHKYSTYFTWAVFGIALAASVSPQGSSSRRPST